jgi:hypothetical protein
MGHFLLFVVPSTFWAGWEDRPRATPPTEDELLREQILEAAALRERIQSGVNLESERTRFTDVIGRIETMLLGRSAGSRNAIRDEWDDETELRTQLALGHFPALRLGEDYLHLLVTVEVLRAKDRVPGVTVPKEPIDLGESIYLSTKFKNHLERVRDDVNRLPQPADPALSKVAERRAKFYELVQGIGGHNIIEVPIAQDAGTFQPPSPLPPGSSLPNDSGSKTEPSKNLEMSEEPELPAPVDRPRRLQMAERLHREVEAVIKQFRAGPKANKINASNQPHEVTIDVFGKWVKEPGGAVLVPIVYADGSEAAPFPLGTLVDRKRPSGEVRVLKVALMSMRHLGIDQMVDMAWFRNREVSQSRSLAESDEFCFKYSLEELKKLHDLSRDHLHGRPIELHVYHTGFEPASVGFYRAVAAVLAGDKKLNPAWVQDKPGWLIVVPYYYRGGTDYEESRDRNEKRIEWF